MNTKMIRKFTGKILLVEDAFMIPPLLISLWQRETKAAAAFLLSMLVILAAAMAANFYVQGCKKEFPCPGGAGMCRTGLDYFKRDGGAAAVPFRRSSQLCGCHV